MSEEIVEKQGEDSSKEAKKFDKILKKMEALLGGVAWARKPKLGAADMPNVIEQLTKKKKEALIETFLTSATALIEAKQKFDAFEKEQRKIFEASILAKKKEFTKEAEKLTAMIEEIDTIESNYLSTLKSITEETETPPAPATGL